MKNQYPINPDSCRRDSVRPYRAWVNQPSTMQPYHHLHGQKGKVTDNGGDMVIFTTTVDGCTASMPIHVVALARIYNCRAHQRFCLRQPYPYRDGMPDRG